MNFDRAAGAFKSPGNPVQVMLQVMGKLDPRDLELSRLRPPRNVSKFKRFLKKLVVRLPGIHRDPNQR